MKDYMKYFISVLCFNLIIGIICMLIFRPFVTLAFVGVAGFLYGRSSHPPDGFFKRYMPFTTPALFVNLYEVALLVVYDKPLQLKGTTGLVATLFYVGFAVIPIITGIFFGVGAAFAKRKIESWRFWYILPLLLIITGVSMFTLHNVNEGKLIIDTDTEKIREEIDLMDYAPFRLGNNVKKADFSPSLTFSENYPRLDGATAAYPVYSALAETLYKGLDEENVGEYVVCSKTKGAYERLVLGETDVVFGVKPSEEQVESAKKNGVEFVMTRIGKEAFVFFVNEENEINDLSVEQIQKIYTKEIKNWGELGGKDEAIVAFQRTKNSGSQTIMENMVMKGVRMPSALQEEVIEMMGGIVYQVADYRNYSNAIGYSFLFYATVMNPNIGVRLISINGIEPSPESIKDGSYPFITDIYAVTTRGNDKNENVKKLLNWLVSNEGKRLINLCGYTEVE